LLQMFLHLMMLFQMEWIYIEENNFIEKYRNTLHEINF